MKERQIFQICPLYDRLYDVFNQKKALGEYQSGYYARNSEIKASVDEKGDAYIVACLDLEKENQADGACGDYFFLVPLLVRYRGTEKTIQEFYPISVLETTKGNRTPLKFELLKNIIIVKEDPNIKLSLYALKINVQQENEGDSLSKIEITLILKNYAMPHSYSGLLHRVIPIQIREAVWYFVARPSPKGIERYAFYEVVHPSHSIIDLRKEEIIVEKDVAETHSNKLIFVATFKNTTRAAAFYRYRYVPEYIVIGIGFLLSAIITLVVAALFTYKMSARQVLFGAVICGLGITVLFWIVYCRLLRKFLK